MSLNFQCVLVSMSKRLFSLLFKLEQLLLVLIDDIFVGEILFVLPLLFKGLEGIVVRLIDDGLTGYSILVDFIGFPLVGMDVALTDDIVAKTDDNWLLLLVGDDLMIIVGIVDLFSLFVALRGL